MSRRGRVGMGPAAAEPVSAAATATAERFTAWARSRRRLWRRTVLGAGAALAVLAGVGWVVLFSPLLELREVEVEGERRLSDAEVVVAALPELGRPLARADTAAVRERLLDKPEVADVEVTRQWPHTLRVRVTERQERAVVALPSGRYGLVDAEGVVFAEDASRPGGLPMVDADPGEPDALHGALAVVTSLPRSLLDDVATVKAPGPEAITLRLRDGASVVWGSAERSDRKAEVLEALMHQEAEVYDVSAPDAPTTRG